MQRCPPVHVQGVCVCAVVEQQSNNVYGPLLARDGAVSTCPHSGRVRLRRGRAAVERRLYGPLPACDGAVSTCPHLVRLPPCGAQGALERHLCVHLAMPHVTESTGPHPLAPSMRRAIQGRRLLLVIVVVDGKQDVVGRQGCGRGRQSYRREVPARADEAGTTTSLFDRFRMVVVALVVFQSYWVGNMFGVCESRCIGGSGVIHQTRTSGIWARLRGRGKSATTGTSPEDGNPW